MAFSALQDTSALGPMLNLGSAPDAFCEFLSDYGYGCQDCPDGAGPYCTDIAGTIDEAAEIEGLDVTQ